VGEERARGRKETGDIGGVDMVFVFGGESEYNGNWVMWAWLEVGIRMLESV
jgi:hypothetical protein